MMIMALFTPVMSTTMNMSPTWELILILWIIPIIFHHNMLLRIRTMRHYAHNCFGYLLIISNTPSLLQPSGFTISITSHFANILSHISLLSMCLIIMNLSPPILCSLMSLYKEVAVPLCRFLLGMIQSTLTSTELLLSMISPVH